MFINKLRARLFKLGALRVILALTLFAPIVMAKNNTPNILWLIAEDLSAADLGSYGNPAAVTPNLDRLAAEGTRYANAFTTTPVCSPSRSSLITGMYNTTINAHNHRSHVGSKSPYQTGYRLPEPVKIIPRYLKEAGYTTFIWGKTDYNFNWDNEYDFDHSTNAPLKPELQNWQQLKQQQPFFAQIHFKETHHPWKGHPKVVDRSRIKLPPIYPETPDAIEQWGQYLDELAALDTKIGSVLQRLKADGLLDNTIIFFLSDHGREQLRAKQWVYDAGIHVPLIVHWPGHLPSNAVDHQMISLIDVSATSLALAGIKPPAYMDGQNFLEPDATPRGHVVATRDRDDETFDRVRAVRTQRYKYIRNYYPELPWTQFNYYIEHTVDGTSNYPMFNLMKSLHSSGELTPEQALFWAPEKPAEELYDLKEDPFETVNLAERKEMAGTLEQMRQYLREWIEYKHPDLGWRDKGAVPERGTRLFVIRQQQPGSPWIDITTVVDDTNGKPCRLRLEYSLDDGRHWHSSHLAEQVSADYGHPVVDNKAEFQISGVVTNRSGGNTIRFRWNAGHPDNGGGALERKNYSHIRFRATQANAVETREPVVSTHGFYRDYPAVWVNSQPFSFDFSDPLLPIEKQDSGQPGVGGGDVIFCGKENLTVIELKQRFRPPFKITLVNQNITCLGLLF